ncbi:MAG TPA: aldo/keto reductase [Polyangia bacterium]|nr:aldo/keto reductase [Polyangia bacterium]
MQIGLGCMRLSTERERDEARAIATIHAALDGDVRLFDTARAYGLDDDDRGHNERLLGRALAAHADGAGAEIVTKGGMARPGGAWRPDGRARAIVADCAASLEALGGRAIDLYLLHAPDPRVTWATSVRALAGLVERGLVARVGVCNVSRRQLEEALAHAPIAAVEVALDEALPGGVVALAIARGLRVLAHAPFGGPKGAARLGRDRELAAAAARLGATPHQLLLAGIAAIDPRIVVLPGARTPESARSAAAAGRLVLDEAARALVEARVGSAQPPAATAARGDGEVVLVAGISGAGKSTHVGGFVAAGYERLNRDERGGTLAGLARALDGRLAAGARRVVLDNTYVTRKSRHAVVRAAARHGLPVRCVWLDVPLVEAQRNAVERMLAAHGRLLAPGEMVGGDDPTRLAPRVQLSQLRALEPPAADEGFAAIEVVPFARTPSRAPHAGRAVALEALRRAGPAILGGGVPGPRLVFDWLPDGDAALVEATRGLEVTRAACAHPGGPPICWCRPPLPGLLLAFAHEAGVDPARLTVVGTSPAHRALAAALHAPFELVG